MRRDSLVSAAPTTVLNVPRSDKHSMSYTRYTRRNASWFSRKVSFLFFSILNKIQTVQKNFNTNLHIKIKKV